jgi:hypothetical protein
MPKNNKLVVCIKIPVAEFALERFKSILEEERIQLANKPKQEGKFIIVELQINE